MTEKPVEILTPFKDITEFIEESGSDAFKDCFQCGRCETYCPWNRTGRRFDVRRIIHESQLGIVAVESEDMWLCVTCRNCVEHCPRGVDTIELMTALRRVLIPDGKVPPGLPTVSAVMAGVATVGNPWKAEPEDRAKWAKDLSVKDFTEGTGVLYFPCCTTAFDPRIQPIGRATAEILAAAGVDFGILGTKENCCGESVRKLGNEVQFKRLARENIKTFIDNGVKKIVVSSPHCYHSFENEYPEFMVDFDVVHSTQYLYELIRDEKISFTKEYPKKVAYHDPCYLGRHNGIYDEPREVLKSVPGLELVEMLDNRAESLCCGAGGGRMWMETAKEERFSDMRIQQAIDAGADVLAVACPYCMVMYKDSVKSVHKEDVLEIRDITEIVREAM
ncbi:(Fe-S)-binding protein [Chloroflexota bacterium]